MARAREIFRGRFEFIIFALLLGAFLLVAAQRLGAMPVPETDEAYTLQVGYEMVNRGQLSLPMYRYLGGNIENTWHSYTPLYFVLLGAHLKIFGWGLLEGRAFNLLTAALVLLMTYLLGRRLFNWRVAMIAVVLLISDQTFFERSRLLRNDFAAAAFAMLAYYLYETAEEKKRGSYYIASGLAAGAGVMCHTNILYMLGAIGLLMLVARGWRVIRQRNLYQFTLAALAVMAYEIAYDIIDYKNFVLQNRDDELHFGLFERWGWLRNIAGEWKRYLRWAAGSADFADVSRATARVFQLLAVAAIIYLAVLTFRRFRRGECVQRAETRLFIVTIFAALFHAGITSHKEIYYMAHLIPWFALCAGVMLNDVLDAVKRMPSTGLLRKTATIPIALVALAFALLLANTYREYTREIRNPEQASFEEIKNVLRGVVPGGVCPVAMKAPELWLAFPEHDRCFATIESRMMDSLDLDGNEYAVMMPFAYHKNRIATTQEFDAKYHLLGELTDTPYGTIRVYYTGKNSDYLALAPKTYQFFGRARGYVSQQQLKQSRAVWGYDFINKYPLELGLLVDAQGSRVEPKRNNRIIDLWSVGLESDGIYQLSFDAATDADEWKLLLIDNKTGAVIYQEPISEQASLRRIERLFKTDGATRIRLAAQPTGRKDSAPLRISRIRISRIPAN